MVLHRAIERGLLAADFEHMTIGMVIDYLVTCQNEDYDARHSKRSEPTRMATAEDIAAF